MLATRGPRNSLIKGLDDEIHQILRKLNAEQVENGGGKRLTISVAYEYIKNSNSSLKRRKKVDLENAIDRVLQRMRDLEDESDSMEGEFDGIEDLPPVIKEDRTLNRYIAKAFVKKPGTPGSTTPKDDILPFVGPATPLQPPTEIPNGDSNTPAKPERQANGEPKAKRRKAEKESRKEVVDRSPPTGISLADLGGVDHVIEELSETVAMPMLYPEAYIRKGVQPPRGVLLHGPPGCGKTMIANAFAAKLGVSYIPVSAPSLVAGMSGESEKKIRDLFEEAKQMAPCLVFIDEIDVIMGKRESAQREMEKRIVAQMLTCMDDMALDKTGGKPVIIIAATNRPDSLDAALRRAGRFNKEINLGVPNEMAREKILRALTQKLELSESFNYTHLAKLTPGFVGADLNDVVSVAGTLAMKRLMAVLTSVNEMDIEIDGGAPLDSQPSTALSKLDALVANVNRELPSDNFSVTYDDFLAAIPKVQPSAKREGFATIPDTTWAHIGALHDVRAQLEMAIIQPIQRPADFARVGITAPTGVLLWGPPGCGKTLLAKAVANESKANFISIKGPELLNKYVGESERAVRQVFERARSSVPCILFFDELDALVPKREDSLSEASSKVVNTLLTELDGLSNRAGIYVVAATNRPDMIDPAMLRPGRLGSSVFVDLPDPEGRVEILKALYRKALPSATAEEYLNLEMVAKDTRCREFSGADLENLRVAAGREALKRGDQSAGEEELTIGPVDWEKALESVKPSVKDKDAQKYRKLRDRGM